ncbi:MAG: YetF domain-containing protein [Pyrinomonadaceae bacterium]
MDFLFKIDWQSMFVPTSSLFEILIRGTIMYLAMFVLLRIFRRQAGALGIADLLVIVVIADAAQNGMAGDSKSITEALLLVTTIVLWDWLFDWLGFRSKFVAGILEPDELMLIKNGRLLRRNLDKEMITEDEIMSQLRQQGIENLSDVKSCFLESNGKFSIITNDDKTKGNKNEQEAVH